MQKIDRKRFFDGYIERFGSLNQSQVNGLEKLLGFMEKDPHIKDHRWSAYMLATIYHECAGTWQPIREKGSRDYFINRYGSQARVGKELGNDTPEEGFLYAGRGYTQVTGERNYEVQESAIRKEYPDVVKRFELRTGRKFDLTVGDNPGDVKDPDNMLDAEISYCSMSVSMRKGLYTGVGLGKYINGSMCDFLGSRKIINGTDKAGLIGGYAVKFKTILELSM